MVNLGVDCTHQARRPRFMRSERDLCTTKDVFDMLSRSVDNYIAKGNGHMANLCLHAYAECRFMVLVSCKNEEIAELKSKSEELKGRVDYLLQMLNGFMPQDSSPAIVEQDS